VVNPWLGFGLNALECIYNYFNAIKGCEGGLQQASQQEVGILGNGFYDPMPSGLSVVEAHMWQCALRVQEILSVYAGFYGDETWLQITDGQALADWLGAFQADVDAGSDAGERISDQERSELVTMAIPEPLTADHVNRFIDRWNRSIEYWSEGIFNLSDVPQGQSTDFIAADVRLSEYERAKQAIEASEAEGFPDPMLALEDAKGKVAQWLEGETGICAKVRIEIDQKAVMTRSAFLGTLEIDNGDTSSSIEGVRVDLDIRDENGTAANDKFAIRGPELSGLTAVDGTGSIAAGGQGVAKYTFIPNREAAPIEPTIYRIGGTLRYLPPGSSEEVVVPLFPCTITVYPDALLKLEYFQQRDVIGDDPFTEEIEPSEPFTLGLLVSNIGHGEAKNLKITSAQPKIIENEKGLLIDFQIIGTQIGDQEVTPALTADFGNVDPGQTKEARWLLTSSLEGRFVDYTATFEHVTGLGDPRLSLIDSVNIHELIHTVRADRPGDDTLYDFLVNDEPDVDVLPDRLYLSDGSIALVNVADTATVDHSASLSDSEVHLTASMTSGWCYIRLLDPGSQLHLSRIVRSDGKEIRIGDNAWETDHVFAEVDQSYHHENRLHLLDYDSTGLYTLFYSENVAPTVEAGPDATINETRTFISSGYFVDPDSDTWTATVDYGDGTGLHNLALNVDKTFNLSHTYVNNGVYTVTVTVIDGEGAIDSDTANVTVSYTGPTADFSASPTSGNEPLTVVFTDLSTSYDGITSWSWNFGDDNSSAEQNPTHQYVKDGNYTVSLTVSEADDDTDTQTKPGYITVTQGPPTISSVNPNLGGQGQALTVIISGSKFTDATAVSFGSGITVNSFNVDSFTQITASITINGSATPGARDVSVTTPGGMATRISGFTVATAINHPPNQPVNVSPANGATGISLTPSLQSSAFSDPDPGDGHAASQWQIRTSSGSYSSPVFDSSTDTSNLTSITIPSGRLSSNTTYYWHVRHKDNNDAWSSYSSETSFSTTPGGCFIATAAYGTPMAEEIQILREFRDEYLLTNSLGQALVGLYYRVSPPIAEFITEHPSLKPIVRVGLLPAVAMSTIAVNTSPAEKAAIIGLLALVSVALAVWAMRRRHRGPEYS
jgi:PKD repeat protein